MIIDAEAAPNVTLRAASAEDVAALVALVNDAYHHAEKHIFPTSTRTERDDLSSRLDGVIVAEACGRIVGCVHVAIEAPRAHYGMLATDLTMHGRGVGSMLVEHAESLARASGCTVMHIETVKEANHIPFYERRGYGITCETDGQTWNDGADWGAVIPWHMVDMEKPL